MNENEHVSVEVQCSGITVESEKVEADRSSHNQAPLAIEEGRTQLKITDEEIEHKLKEVMEAEVKITRTTGENVKSKKTAGENPKPKIQKVHEMLKIDQGDQYFEPKSVSIGPIHHENEKLKIAETYKHKLAATFITQSEVEGLALYNKIKEKIKELRDCYYKEVIENYGDESLAWMLFLDGCFLLQFIYSDVYGELKNFNFKIDQVAFARQDLFLLENQIPFQVLRLLMNSSNRKEKLERSINMFIRGNVVVEEKKLINWRLMNEPAHRLDLLQLTLLQVITPLHRVNLPNITYRKTFRNIRYLKSTGIRLWHGKVDFRTSFLTGYLYLPRLVVDESTRSKFVNLAAYEMCPDNKGTEFEVISYICFLDSLIDRSVDVKELISAKIIHNCLGSDEEVANLFNEISTALVPNNVMYNHIYAKIDEYYENSCMNKLMTWKTQAHEKYFSSPWSIVAFLAGVLALALTGIQTWYQVKSPQH